MMGHYICFSCRQALKRVARSPYSVRRNFTKPTRSMTATSQARSRLPPRLHSQTPKNCSGSSETSLLFLQRRPFSSSSQKAAVILNPRKDDDGQDMIVELTPRATKRLQEIMKKDANPNLCLRVQVESGGCHGFQYLMSLTDLADVSQEEDTVFESDYGKEDGSSISGEGTAKIVMDEPSLELLKGSKVDYTMELIGSQFKIVDNPLATSSCGCGTSFDVKA